MQLAIDGVGPAAAVSVLGSAVVRQRARAPARAGAGGSGMSSGWKECGGLRPRGGPSRSERALRGCTKLQKRWNAAPTRPAARQQETPALLVADGTCSPLAPLLPGCSLVGPNGVEAGAALACAGGLGQRHVGHEALIDLAARLLPAHGVSHLQEAVATLRVQRGRDSSVGVGEWGSRETKVASCKAG